ACGRGGDAVDELTASEPGGRTCHGLGSFLRADSCQYLPFVDTGQADSPRLWQGSGPRGRFGRQPRIAYTGPFGPRCDRRLAPVGWAKIPPMRITTGILTGVLLGVVTWLPGCSDEPVVRTYAAAKEVLVPTETAPQPQTSSIALAANLQGGALT